MVKSSSHTTPLVRQTSFWSLKRKRTWLLGGLSLSIAAAVMWLALDLRRIKRIVVQPARPAKSIPGNIDGLLLKLERGEPYDATKDFTDIDGACRFLDGRWDTADFRLPSLIRVLWLHGDRLDALARSRIQSALLGFKYWMDQGGDDSMCYWSENHQILFATGEYLVGRMFPAEVFAVDGRTGKEHEAIARKRLLAWLGQRWNYGFIEWYSNSYYAEDAAALANLVDFAGEERDGRSGDPEIATKAAIVLDLLLYDLASQSWQGAFVSTMGRGYERGKKGNGDALRSITEWAFGIDRGASDRTGKDVNLIHSRKYHVPAAIRAISHDARESVICASIGLDLGELRSKGLLGTETPQMMMLWGMEAFSNPEAIDVAVNYAHDHRLFSNKFLHPLSILDLGLLRETSLLPRVSRFLRSPTDGVAIQRANTYTYRTAFFQLATAQRYHPGGYGDQQHIWSALIAPEIAIFTTHPAQPLEAKGVLSVSPNYWVGNGRNPDAAQYRNKLLCIYDVPEKGGFRESPPIQMTHAYFPRKRFDESSVEDSRAFGRIGNAWVALIASHPVSYPEGSDEDLIQKGARTAWVCELGSPDTDASYDAFKTRIANNKFAFDPEGRVLSWTSAGDRLELTWGGDFKVNDQPVVTQYPRFDSPWAKASRKPDRVRIEADGKKLELSFEPLQRNER